MDENIISSDMVRQTIGFHGHSCPGLAFGIRVAEQVLARFGSSRDEELVAVVENDMCAVDAIQFLTGCTFGKGNLLFLDYGKNAYTFYQRATDSGIRIVVRPEIGCLRDDRLKALLRKKAGPGLDADEEQLLAEHREQRRQRIMEAPADELFILREVAGPVPRRARVMESLVCESCGEPVMESRSRRFFGRTLCIPCFDAVDNWHRG
ncbi:MAG TPA: formylmethanofuran dehydrogenase [Desulfobulbus sp.]|nr:formylmethanofuran dehydrogenase [Desulfobulbus sp.]